MQVESCSSALGVSNRGVSEKQLTSNTVQQHPSTPKRHTVLYISPPPEDLLDNSRMSCQDEGCGLESEQSCSMWMEDSPSNFSNMSTSSYNDNTEVPRKSRKRNPKQRPGVKRRDCEESNMDIFDADSAKAPHYVLSQLTTDNKGNSKAGNGLVFTFFFQVLSPLCKTTTTKSFPTFFNCLTQVCIWSKDTNFIIEIPENFNLKLPSFTREKIKHQKILSIVILLWMWLSSIK